MVYSGGSSLADLLCALEEYLPVVLGLAKDGIDLAKKETCMTNAWYEVLSVFHSMAMLCFSEANLLLLPKTSSDEYQPKLSEENIHVSIEIFLKAAGYLDCALSQVLPQLLPELRFEKNSLISSRVQPLRASKVPSKSRR